MKKISTVTTKKVEKNASQKLTIGLDLGRSIQLVLGSGGSGRSSSGTESGDPTEGHEGSLRRDAAQPVGVGNGDALPRGGAGY